jgi:membrane fusion protein (multidrug efflux system)
MSKAPLKSVELVRSPARSEARETSAPQIIEVRELSPRTLDQPQFAPVQAIPRAVVWRRRIVGWSTALALLALVALGISSWMNYHSRYVASSNAIVRGHLAQLGTRVAAVVSSVEVEPGQQVVKDDILLRFDDAHLRARAEAARAELLLLERELEVEKREIQHEKRLLDEQDQEGKANLAAAQADVAVASIQAEDAKKRFEVQRQLQAEQIAPAEAVRAARAEWDTRIELVKSGQAKYEALRSADSRRRLARAALEIREFRLGVQEAQVEKARATRDLADADLQNTIIRAPASGAIVRRVVQPGASVEPGSPTLVMWLGNQLWVEAWIDESDVAMIDHGSKAVVTFPSFAGQEFAGRVTTIGFTSDYEVPDDEVPQPRRVRMRSDPVVAVRIELDAPPAQLRPGLSAVVAIERKR